MASEAQVKQELLEKELAKPYPDSDVVYHLETTRPYWNTIDTDKMRRGAEKLEGYSLRNMLEKLAPPTNKKESK